MIFWLLQNLHDMYIWDAQWKFLLLNKVFIVLLFTTSNQSEKSKCFNSPLDTISSVIGAYVELSRAWHNSSYWILLVWTHYFDTKYQRTFAFQQMLFHYPSFDKHFSFLSMAKHYKSRVFSHTVLIDSITKFATLNQNIVYCNVYCIIGIFRNLAGNFEHISKTHSITESIKICRFKTFWVEYFA